MRIVAWLMWVWCWLVSHSAAVLVFRKEKGFMEWFNNSAVSLLMLIPLTFFFLIYKVINFMSIRTMFCVKRASLTILHLDQK